MFKTVDDLREEADRMLKEFEEEPATATAKEIERVVNLITNASIIESYINGEY